MPDRRDRRFLVSHPKDTGKASNCNGNGTTGSHNVQMTNNLLNVQSLLAALPRVRNMLPLTFPDMDNAGKEFT